MQNKARPATHASNADVLLGLTSEGSLRTWFFSFLGWNFLDMKCFPPSESEWMDLVGAGGGEGRGLLDEEGE